MRIEIVGHYRIGHEPWRLIEVQASGFRGQIEFSDFALPIRGQPQSNWQAPWDERVISDDAQRGSIHACFFLYVESDEPLQTPVGSIALPPVTELPSRLKFIEFEAP